MKKSDFALFFFSANFGNKIQPTLETKFGQLWKFQKKDKNRRFLAKKVHFGKKNQFFA